MFHMSCIKPRETDKNVQMHATSMASLVFMKSMGVLL